MLKEIQVPFYPSAANCLAWSKDGELAIAAGEHVHILVPKRGNTAKSKGVQDANPWVAVRFRVNSFTTEEWPMQEPASFEDFSIGEEQSLGIVTALSWSAPGLAKHRRSVLAVLTSNLVLSLWESKTDPKEQDSWERVLVVNQSLREYFFQNDDETDTSKSGEGLLRRKTRIRASAWAEPMRWDGNHGNLSYQSRWGMFLLAVTNDNRDIIFLRVASPYSMEFGRSDSWNVMAWWHGRALPSTDEESQAVLPSLLSATMAKKRFIRDLAWSPWQFPKYRDATLTYQCGGNLYSLRVVFFSRPFRITAGFENTWILIREPVCSQVGSLNECRVLSYCINNSGVSTHVTAVASRDAVNLRVMSIDEKLNTHNNRTYRHQLRTKADRWTHARGETETVMMHPWDQVSGFAICEDPDAADIYLYITTHLSHLEVLKYTPTGTPTNHDGLQTWSTCATSLLQSRMSDCRAKFDHTHDLGGLSVMKTWGLASLGGYVAACVTMHPGDMVEYTTQSLERSTILFGEIDYQKRNFPWEKVTDHAITEAEAQARILDAIFAQEPIQDGFERSSLTNKIIYAAACASMLLRDAGRFGRLERAEGALRNLESVTGYHFEPEIACIERLRTLEHVNSSDLIIEVRSSTQCMSKEYYLDTPAAFRTHEMCSICGECIGWDSLDAACCISGHLFVRCALTFLTIQEPAVSKYCENCEREYLDEQFLLDPAKHDDGPREEEFQRPIVKVYKEVVQEGSAGFQMEAFNDVIPEVVEEKDVDDPSLARVLFSTFDTCIYCGGKFLG